MKVDYYYKMGGREAAANFYNRRSNSSVLTLTIDTPSATISHELTVDEAEEIANELIEYVNEIKELARSLKGESA